VYHLIVVFPCFKLQCHHLSGRRFLLDSVTLALNRVQQIPCAFGTSTVAGLTPLFGFSRLSSRSIEQTFVRSQRTKAHPIRNQRHGSGVLTTEHSKIVDPDITLYHKPTQHSININLHQRATAQDNDSQDKEVMELVSAPPQSVRMVNLHPNQFVNETYESSEKLKDALRAIHRHHTAATLQDDKSSTNLSSIEELMCREIKPDLEWSQLAGNYARLSKIRLTGV